MIFRLAIVLTLFVIGTYAQGLIPHGGDPCAVTGAPVPGYCIEQAEQRAKQGYDKFKKDLEAAAKWKASLYAQRNSSTAAIRPAAVAPAPIVPKPAAVTARTAPKAVGVPAPAKPAVVPAPIVKPAAPKAAAQRPTRTGPAVTPTTGPMPMVL
jgi:hypothetical protein